MHNDTAYGLLGEGRVRFHKMIDGVRTLVEDNLTVIEFGDAAAMHRHGALPDGSPQPYKGYKGDSNYCIEIVRAGTGKWHGEVISTFRAYSVSRAEGAGRLRDRALALSGRPLVMRLIVNDCVHLEHEGKSRVLRFVKVDISGKLVFADHNAANVDKRNRQKEAVYVYKTEARFRSLAAARLQYHR